MIKKITVLYRVGRFRNAEMRTSQGWALVNRFIHSLITKIQSENMVIDSRDCVLWNFAENSLTADDLEKTHRVEIVIYYDLVSCRFCVQMFCYKTSEKKPFILHKIDFDYQGNVISTSVGMDGFGLTMGPI